MKTTLLFLSVFLTTALFGQYSGIRCESGKGELSFGLPDAQEENPATGNFYNCEGEWVALICESDGFYKVKNDPMPVDGINWYGTLRLKSWYKNGNVKFDLSIKDGIGQSKQFYKNGVLRTYKEYNHFVSFAESYYENGQLWAQGEYEEGIANGVFKFWFENGQLRKLYNIKNGENNGNCKEWFENGQLRKDYNYSDGKMSGVCKRWSEDGTLIKDEFIKIEEKTKMRN